MKTRRTKPGHGEQHRWLLAGLLRMRYEWKVASTIATRTLMGHTLFPNEAADAAKVLAELNQGEKQ